MKENKNWSPATQRYFREGKIKQYQKLSNAVLAREIRKGGIMAQYILALRKIQDKDLVRGKKLEAKLSKLLEK